MLDSLAAQIHGDDPDRSPLYGSIKNKVRFVHGDVTVREDWEKALKDQDAIVHLAAETGTGQSMYEIQKYTGTNIGGTSLMLDILTNSKHRVRKVVVASSRAIYGEGRYLSRTYGYVYPLSRTEEYMSQGDFECKYPGEPAPLTLVGTTEDSLIHPTSVYGITKHVQEQLVMTVCPTLGIAPVAFRYQNVYGPGQSLSNPYTGILGQRELSSRGYPPQLRRSDENQNETRFRTPVEFRQGDSAIYRLGEYPGYPERPVRRLHRRDENERTL